MSEIRFRATRRLHDSGYRILGKSGDLEYDLVHPTRKKGLTNDQPTPRSY